MPLEHVNGRQHTSTAAIPFLDANNEDRRRQRGCVVRWVELHGLYAIRDVQERHDEGQHPRERHQEERGESGADDLSSEV